MNLNIFRRQPATPEPPELIYTKLAAALNAAYSGLLFRAERHESRSRVVFIVDRPPATVLLCVHDHFDISHHATHLL